MTSLACEPTRHCSGILVASTSNGPPNPVRALSPSTCCERIRPSRLFHFRVIVAVMIRIFGHDAGHAAAFVLLKVELEVNSHAIEFGSRKRAKLASPGRACAREFAFLVGDLYPIVLISILPHVRRQGLRGHR